MQVVLGWQWFEFLVFVVLGIFNVLFAQFIEDMFYAAHSL